jgi:hypothetical protein
MFNCNVKMLISIEMILQREISATKRAGDIGIEQERQTSPTSLWNTDAFK